MAGLSRWARLRQRKCRQRAARGQALIAIPAALPDALANVQVARSRAKPLAEADA